LGLSLPPCPPGPRPLWVRGRRFRRPPRGRTYKRTRATATTAAAMATTAIVESATTTGSLYQVGPLACAIRAD
jgi:hypothetical protein